MPPLNEATVYNRFRRILLKIINLYNIKNIHTIHRIPTSNDIVVYLHKDLVLYVWIKNFKIHFVGWLMYTIKIEIVSA